MLRAAFFAFVFAAVRGAPGDDSSDSSSDSSSTYCDPCGADVSGARQRREAVAQREVASSARAAERREERREGVAGRAQRINLAVARGQYRRHQRARGLHGIQLMRVRARLRSR